MFSIVFFLIVITSLIYLWFKKKFAFWSDRGFPYVESNSIPLGSMTKVGFTEHTTDFMLREYNNFKHKGPGFGCFTSVQPTFVPTDPELMKDILVRNFDNFHERGLPINREVDPLSAHLFLLNGQEWKDLRAKLTPTFTSGKMKMMFPIVESMADRMIEYLKPFEVTNEALEVNYVLKMKFSVSKFYKRDQK